MQGMWSFCNDSRLKYILLSYFVIYVYTCFTTQNFQKILSGRVALFSLMGTQATYLV